MNVKHVLCKVRDAAQTVAGKAAAVVGLAVGSAVAMTPAGATVDTTAVVATIGDAATAGAAIGVAILGMYYGIKLYKWVKGAG